MCYPCPRTPVTHVSGLYTERGANGGVAWRFFLGVDRMIGGGSMSRLDRHVALVQSKLGLGRFFAALAYTALGFLGVVWVSVVVGRVVQIYLPQPLAMFWGGAGLAVVGALVWSLLHKPTDVAAAAAIDERLGLKEKFSTAL